MLPTVESDVMVPCVSFVHGAKLIEPFCADGNVLEASEARCVQFRSEDAGSQVT